MQQAATMSVEALIQSASNATSILRKATTAKAADAQVGTDVATLHQLVGILERMASALGAERTTGDCHESALQRIASLKVRGAGELIEQGKWKRLCEELQSIAQSALHPEQVVISEGKRA